MACKDIKPPGVPELDLKSLPKMKLPRGGTIAQIKSLATGQGLSGAMANVTGLISSNVSKLAGALNPAALVDKVAGAVGDIVGEIGDTVNQAIDAVTNLPNRLADMIPKMPSFDLTGKAEFQDLQQAVGKGKCDAAFLKQAGQVTGGLSDAAEKAAGALAPKELKDIKENGKVAEDKANQIKSAVTAGAAASAVTAAAQEDKNDATVQETIQSPVIETKKREQRKPERLYVDSYISAPTPAWSSNATSASAMLSYIQPEINAFRSSVGSGDPADNENFHVHTHDDSIDYDGSAASNQSLIDGVSYNSRQALSVFREFLGDDGENADWENDETYTTPSRYISLWIRSSVISSAPDRFGVGMVVNVQVSMQLIHTVTPGDSMFGNYEIETATITRRALGKDHANGYKAATSMALEKFMNPLQNNNYTQWFNDNFSI